MLPYWMPLLPENASSNKNCIVSSRDDERYGWNKWGYQQYRKLDTFVYRVTVANRSKCEMTPSRTILFDLPVKWVANTNHACIYENKLFLQLPCPQRYKSTPLNFHKQFQIYSGLFSSQPGSNHKGLVLLRYTHAHIIIPTHTQLLKLVKFF